eukprot:3701818-Prorocentrum_lima.AAC.1
MSTLGSSCSPWACRCPCCCRGRWSSSSIWAVLGASVRVTRPRARASASVALVPGTPPVTPDALPLRHPMHGWYRCARDATPASRSI